MFERWRWMDAGVVGGAGIFVALGAWLFWIGARNVWWAVSSEHWPKVTAVASSSQSASIEFHYQVGGVRFVTTVRHFGQTEANDGGDAELAAYRYPPGRIIFISHHPHDPWIATAESGLTSDALWLPGAGLAFAVPGIMFIVMWFGLSRNNSRGTAIGLGMFGSIFATLGLIFLFNGLPNLWRSYESPHWPKTKGIVVCGKPDPSLNSSKPPYEDAEFKPLKGTHFIYRFEVHGRRYYSNVRRFGQIDDPRMQHDSLYPLGAEVLVAYSPHNPAISAVETGLANENYFIPGVGAAFFLFGLAVLVFGIPVLTR